MQSVVLRVLIVGMMILCGSAPAVADGAPDMPVTPTPTATPFRTPTPKPIEPAALKLTPRFEQGTASPVIEATEESQSKDDGAFEPVPATPVTLTATTTLQPVPTKALEAAITATPTPAAVALPLSTPAPAEDENIPDPAKELAQAQATIPPQAATQTAAPLLNPLEAGQPTAFRSSLTTATPVQVAPVPAATPGPAVSIEKLVQETGPELVELGAVSQQATIEQAQPTEAETGHIGEAQEVESTLFDLYLGDKFQGYILASYTDDWFEVEAPQDILEQLPQLQGGEKLLPLLSGRIRRSREMRGLGTFRYDLNTFRIILTPAPEFLKGSELDLAGQIPEPETKLSFQQRIGLAYVDQVSGSSESSDRNAALSHRTIISSGRYVGKINGAALESQPYEITEASAGGVISDYQLTAGLLQMRGQSFASSLQYAGVSLDTAEQVLLDQDLVRGSKFEIFVPSRSRVEFYRSGRLLSVQVLDFGLQEIDTSAFPQGSYDVDVIITETSGRVTRQTRFFTKSGFLASRAAPVFSLGAGTIRSDLDFNSDSVYQAGVRWRAADIIDLGISAYGSDDITLGALEFNGLYRDTRFGGIFNASTWGDSGVQGYIDTSFLGFDFGTSVSKTLNLSEKSEALQPTAIEPILPPFDMIPRPDRVNQLFFQDRSTLSTSIYRAFGPFDVRIASDRSIMANQPKRFSVGPSVEWRLLNNVDTDLRYQTSYLRTDQGDFYSNGLLFRYRLGEKLTLNSQLVVRREYENDTDEGVLYTALSYDAKVRAERGDRILLANEVRTDKEDTGRETFVTDQLSIDHTGDYLQTVGFARDVRSSAEGQTALGLNAISSFLVSGDGSVSVSYPINQESVFIADIQTRSTKTKFEIVFNDQIYDVIEASKRSAIGVSPYRTYRVGIRPTESSELVDYDPRIETITFFPGNIVQRTWKVDKVFIIIGRLVDKDGIPIPRQRLRGVREYSSTEADGSFQAEITGNEDLYIDSKTYKCRVDLELEEFPEYLVDLGDVVCE